MRVIHTVTEKKLKSLQKLKLLKANSPFFMDKEDKTNYGKPKTSLPSSETFDGVEGIKTIFNRILNFFERYNSDKILKGYGSAGKFEEFLRWSLPHFIDKRVKLGVKFRGIYNQTNLGKEKKKLPLSEIRLLPKEFESPSFYLIYPDHVAIIIFSEEPLGILIKSKQITESYNLYFKILWGVAKK